MRGIYLWVVVRGGLKGYPEKATMKRVKGVYICVRILSFPYLGEQRGVFVDVNNYLLPP